MVQLVIQAVLHKYTSLICLSEHHVFIRTHTNTGQVWHTVVVKATNVFLSETGSFIHDCLYHLYPEQE